MQWIRTEPKARGGRRHLAVEENGLLDYERFRTTENPKLKVLKKFSLRKEGFQSFLLVVGLIDLDQSISWQSEKTKNRGFDQPKPTQIETPVLKLKKRFYK